MPLRKWTASASARRFAREVVDRLTRQLYGNRAPWQKQWDRPSGSDLPSFNPTIDKRFKGLNNIQLRCVAEEKGFNDPHWITSAAAQKMGAHVRSGEKGTTVEFHRYGSHQGCTHHTYTVFNAEQIDGLPPLEKHLPREPRDWEVCDRAERMIRNTGAQVVTHDQDYSVYDDKSDTIVLPHQEKFKSPQDYYSHAVAELSKWTGHKDRFDRESLHFRKDYDEEFAREYMRVHIASMNVCSELRLPYNQTAAGQEQAWGSSINYNPDELRSAVRDADRISHYLLQHARDPDRGLDVNQVPRVARGVDELPDRNNSTRREPAPVEYDQSQSEHMEKLSDMPKPFISYPHGASGAYPKPSNDRSDDTFSR